MSHSRETRLHDRVLKVMLIEDDPVFRLGLVACLEPLADLQVVVQADATDKALQLLWELCASRDTIANQPNANQPNANQPNAKGNERAARSLDLIILNLDLGQASSQGVGLALCQQLRTQFPQFPLLLLGSTLELTRLAAAFQLGAGGYCLKGTGVTELVTAMRQVASGQPYWAEGIQAMSQLTRRSTADATSVRILPNETVLTRSNQRWLTWRRKLRRSGVGQIEQAIAELEIELQADRSVLDRLILAGQRRELYTARWLVNRLLPASDVLEQIETRQTLNVDRQATPSLAAEAASEATSNKSPSALTETIADSIQSPQSALFQITFTKLQGNLQNLTATALEIDILKDAKKRELLHIVLRNLQDILAALRSHLLPDQFETKRSAILHDLWQASVTDFFGKYYTVQVDTQPIEVVAVLLQDVAIVEAEMLAKIPLFPEFLSHLLFQTPLTIEEATYAVGTVEARTRIELLLQNVMIQIANAVMQPLLNRFGSVTAIKQTFYDKRLLSNREIERFRNDLSWKYRTQRVFAEPTAIFESHYSLLTLTENGISKTTIYAPRNDELTELSGLPFLVTLILEARDAIVPRVRTAVSFLGRGIVYVLTEIIGRGIGLIGRGVIKGVGNALQDTKPKRSERWR
ncbi:MAG: DUF3685 domain-containing protein [Tildeniella nuda ZEHNDER 1965/U140]|jgi:DNA-binding NarL/FixJ family response regulator|nr:DUF3685 domain-containing protein [Tildeniella nuda ZEHNDER 1965/U140]